MDAEVALFKQAPSPVLYYSGRREVQLVSRVADTLLPPRRLLHTSRAAAIIERIQYVTGLPALCGCGWLPAAPVAPKCCMVDTMESLVEQVWCVRVNRVWHSALHAPFLSVY